MNGSPYPLEQPVHARRWLALILLLGTGLRLYHLGSLSIWYDEAYSLYLTQHANFSGTLLDFTKNSDAPLYAYLVRAWTGCIVAPFGLPVTSPWNDFLVRLLPALFGVATMPLLFVLTRRLTGDSRIALTAAFLHAVSPFHIYYAQELRVYTVNVVVGLCAIYFMWRALNEDRPWQWLAFSVSLALLFYSHFVSVWVIFAFSVYFVLVLPAYPGRRVRLLVQWTAYNLLTMALITPGLLMAFKINAMVGALESWYPKPGLRIALITFKNFFAGYGFQPMTYWPLFLLAVLCFAAGLFALRHRWRAATLLAILVLLPIFCNVMMWRLRDFSFYEHRLFSFSGTVALIAVAAGLRSLPRPLGTAALALFCLLTLPSLRDHAQHRLHPVESHRLGVFDKVDFRGAAAFIQAGWQPGDVLVHESTFSIYSMRYYLDVPQHHLAGDERDRAIYLRYMGDETLLGYHGLLPIPLEQAAGNAPRVWLVEPFGVIFDGIPQSIPARETLSKRYDLASEHVLDGVRIALYTARETVAGTGQLNGVAP